MLRKSKLIAIRESKILLVRNRRSKQYNLPGGKAWKNETPIRTLYREVTKQELPAIQLRNIRRWRNPPRFKTKKTAYYFANAIGPLKVGHEIDRAARVRKWWKLKISRSTRRTLELLAVRGYLKR